MKGEAGTVHPDRPKRGVAERRSFDDGFPTDMRLKAAGNYRITQATLFDDGTLIYQLRFYCRQKRFCQFAENGVASYDG